jgi:hypothetical protein
MLKNARGIDVLLLKGAVDPEFRDQLDGHWAEAAERIGLDLTEAEQAVLRSVPGSVLVEMSARMHVPSKHRPVFLGKTAAAMIALAASLGAAACAPPPPPPPPPLTPVTVWLVDADVNEPDHWQPRAIVIAGIAPQLNERTQKFESDDRGPEPGDRDPATVNEPEVWDPPMPMFGIAPAWDERTHDYESEDEAR